MIVKIDYDRLLKWASHQQIHNFKHDHCDQMLDLSSPDGNLDSQVQFGYDLATAAGDRDVAAVTAPSPYEGNPNVTYYFYVPKTLDGDKWGLVASGVFSSLAEWFIVDLLIKSKASK